MKRLSYYTRGYDPGLTLVLAGYILLLAFAFLMVILDAVPRIEGEAAARLARLLLRGAP